jgi:membrane protein implicated in regulation of membrane protease activity
MTNTSIARANVVGFLAVLALSAVTMVWLFWHYPLKTIIASVAVLAALGISGRLARSIETETAPDLDQGEHII